MHNLTIENNNLEYLPVEGLLRLQQELHVLEEDWPIDSDEELEDHQFGLVEVKSWSYHLCAWQRP